jgi:anti-anti-sigma factor
LIGMFRLEAHDGSSAERPLILDLSAESHDRLAAGVRDGWRGPRHDGANLVVIDLGERRMLPPDAIEELILTHRALLRAHGRCAVVVGPALAAQLSLAYPEGILWAADRQAAVVALGPRRASIAATATLRPRRRRLHVELSGEIDLATLPAVEALLARTLAVARQRREIVFDLTGLTFVDLVALRAITTAAVRCQLAGAPTRVTGAGPQVQRLVRHLGWQDQLPGIDDPPPSRGGPDHHPTARRSRRNPTAPPT